LGILRFVPLLKNVHQRHSIKPLEADGCLDRVIIGCERIVGEGDIVQFRDDMLRRVVPIHEQQPSRALRHERRNGKYNEGERELER
jgi:hypothetical protein